MEEEYIRRIVTALILVTLLILSFFLLKPLLLAIVIGIILAFIFNPVYEWILKKTHSKNLSATIICVLLFLIIFIPLWFLTPIILEESFKLFQTSQEFDFTAALKTISPSLFASEAFSAEIASTLHCFVTNLINNLMTALGGIILNFPRILLQITVVFFVLFFLLRDKEELFSYLRGLSPLPKDVEKKFIESSKGITISVIYGEIVVGIIQGLIIGAGFLIFEIPNALILTLLAILVGILPIIGTAIVWIPVAIYLIVQNNTAALIGIIIFGSISSWIDTFLRPLIVSKKTNIHPSVLLVGMIGGLFLFGILGFILGPLILAYLLIMLELYRNKKSPGLINPPD